VQQYVGHGIGRIMHENPQVPNFVSRDMRKHDFRLEEGLVLAVEPMVNMGRPEAEEQGDHWTVVTRDGLPSVHVEHTLALTKEGLVIVTADETPPPPSPAPAAPVGATGSGGMTNDEARVTIQSPSPNAQNPPIP
jgi:methionyl aminopeptidase